MRPASTPTRPPHRRSRRPSVDQELAAVRPCPPSHPFAFLRGSKVLPFSVSLRGSRGSCRLPLPFFAPLRVPSRIKGVALPRAPSRSCADQPPPPTKPLPIPRKPAEICQQNPIVLSFVVVNQAGPANRRPSSLKAGAVIAAGVRPVEELPDSLPRCLQRSIVGMLPHETVSGGACPVTAM